jgi:hypothetical protein
LSAVCVTIYNHISLKNFKKIGGFVDGVKISKQSKKYCGLAKNAVLNSATELVAAKLGKTGFEPVTSR